jgi:hypothetical protein
MEFQALKDRQRDRRPAVRFPQFFFEDSVCCSRVLPEPSAASRAARAMSAEPPVASFTIRADWFDRGNVRVSLPGQSYADQYACIWNAGELPNQTEYDIDFPVTARYTISALYAAHASRPVEIHLNGERIHLGFASVTGSWQTSSARWETQCTVEITAGSADHQAALSGSVHAAHLRAAVRIAGAFSGGLAAGPRRGSAASSRLLPIASGAPDPGGAVVGRSGPRPADRGDAGGAVSTGLDGGNRRTGDALPSSPPPRTPWVARLTRTAADGSRAGGMLELSPERLQEMLRRTEQLIDDFHSLDQADRQWLEGSAGSLPANWPLSWMLGRPIVGRPERLGGFCQIYLDGLRLQRHVAANNPLLDFERLLLVKRGVGSPALGLPQNWQSNCVLPASGLRRRDRRLTLGHRRIRWPRCTGPRSAFRRRLGSALRRRPPVVFVDRRAQPVARVRVGAPTGRVKAPRCGR